MKAKILDLFLNGLFLTCSFAAAAIIATIAITIKVNEARSNLEIVIPVTVEKNEISVLSLQSGVVQNVTVSVGQSVEEGDILVEADNPQLRARIETLEQFTNNLSAQTEARVGIIQLENLTSTAPKNGTINNVFVNAGHPIEEGTALVTMLTHDNSRLLAEFTTEEYLLAKKAGTVRAYHSRLYQFFEIRPTEVRPDVSDAQPGSDSDEKKIGLYYEFVNPEDASAMIHNEDLEITLYDTDTITYKPIKYIVNFWDKVLSLGKRALPININK